MQTLAKAASMADDYALTHKNHFGRNKNNGSPKSNYFSGKNPQGNVSTNSPSAQNFQSSSQSDNMGKNPQNHLFLHVVIAESMIMSCQIAGR